MTSLDLRSSPHPKTPEGSATVRVLEDGDWHHYRELLAAWVEDGGKPSSFARWMRYRVNHRGDFEKDGNLYRFSSGLARHCGRCEREIWGSPYVTEMAGLELRSRGQTTNRFSYQVRNLCEDCAVSWLETHGKGDKVPNLLAALAARRKSLDTQETMPIGEFTRTETM